MNALPNLIQQLYTIKFNGQCLINEQIFDHYDFEGIAYRTIAEFANRIIVPGMTIQDFINRMRARYHSVSQQPFADCNRLTVTQLYTTIYYDPSDINDDDDDRIIIQLPQPKIRSIRPSKQL